MALTFHLGVAYLMGLNLFLFAFPATFPAVYWAAQSVAGNAG